MLYMLTDLDGDTITAERADGGNIVVRVHDMAGEIALHTGTSGDGVAHLKRATAGRMVGALLDLLDGEKPAPNPDLPVGDVPLPGLPFPKWTAVGPNGEAIVVYRSGTNRFGIVAGAHRRTAAVRLDADSARAFAHAVLDLMAGRDPDRETKGTDPWDR